MLYNMQELRKAPEMRAFQQILIIFRLFYSGKVINKSYFPVLVPTGITGNLLSFMASIHRIYFETYFSVLIVFLP